MNKVLTSKSLTDHSSYCFSTTSILWDPVIFRRDIARIKNKKIEIQTLWECASLSAVNI